MSQPFTVTFIEGVTETRLKPGWYKRAAAAARAADTRRITTAPQRGDPRADAKAIDYARWLARRDGIELPDRHLPSVVWEACAAGMRPRAVAFHGRPGAPVVIDLPNWSYVAPDVVAVTLLEWAAPVVTETFAAPALLPLDAEQAIGHLADWHDVEPEAFEIAGTFDADTGPVQVEAAIAPVCVEQVVYGISVVNELTASAVEATSEPALMSVFSPSFEAAKMDMPAEPDAEWCPDERSHPVVALALSHRAREELFARVLDGTFADGVRTAKCGAWRLTLQDALDLQDIASVRWVGMPRKPYTRKPVAAEALATVVATIPATAAAATPCFDTHPAAFYPGALRPDYALTLHGPSM